MAPGGWNAHAGYVLLWLSFGSICCEYVLAERTHGAGMEFAR